MKSLRKEKWGSQAVWFCFRLGRSDPPTTNTVNVAHCIISIIVSLAFQQLRSSSLSFVRGFSILSVLYLSYNDSYPRSEFFAIMQSTAVLQNVNGSWFIWILNIQTADIESLVVLTVHRDLGPYFMNCFMMIWQTVACLLCW